MDFLVELMRFYFDNLIVIAMASISFVVIAFIMIRRDAIDKEAKEGKTSPINFIRFTPVQKINTLIQKIDQLTQRNLLPDEVKLKYLRKRIDDLHRIKLKADLAFQIKQAQCGNSISWLRESTAHQEICKPPWLDEWYFGLDDKDIKNISQLVYPVNLTRAQHKPRGRTMSLMDALIRQANRALRNGLISVSFKLTNIETWESLEGVKKLIQTPLGKIVKVKTKINMETQSTRVKFILFDTDGATGSFFSDENPTATSSICCTPVSYKELLAKSNESEVSNR